MKFRIANTTSDDARETKPPNSPSTRQERLLPIYPRRALSSIPGNSSLIPVSNLRNVHLVSRILAFAHNLCRNVSHLTREVPCKPWARTSVRGRHSGGHGSAHGHDGEGEEDEDVLGVHFGREVLGKFAGFCGGFFWDGLLLEYLR